MPSRDPIRGPGSNQYQDKPPLPVQQELNFVRHRSREAAKHLHETVTEESNAGANLPLVTSTRDVLNRFLISSEAQRRWKTWRKNPKRSDVVETVESHTSKAVYQTTPQEVEEVCRRTGHALGNVRKKDVDNIKEVRDWNPPFAFTHVFHLTTEKLQHLPTFSEVREFCRSDEVIRANLWEPALDAIHRASSQHSPEMAKAAMTWRIGNAYYSYLKESHVLSTLRDLGVPVEVHPMADALFRTDFWVGDTNIDLYISNPRYKTQFGSGRKSKSKDLLADANPPFKFEVLELQTRHEFGTVHLPDKEQIKKLAPKLMK